jgi:hypothetical protein
VAHPYLNVADGQLAAASATLFTAPVEGAIVQVTLSNTGASQQIILLTILRAGSTARRVRRIVLEKDESDYIVGLPMSPADVLAGYTTSALAVDYLVGISLGPFSITTRDADGFPKSSAALSVTLPDDASLSAGEVQMSGQLGEIIDLLMKIS